MGRLADAVNVAPGLSVQRCAMHTEWAMDLRVLVASADEHVEVQESNSRSHFPLGPLTVLSVYDVLNRL